jgi:thiamine transport system substrate-binding protein
VEVAALVESSDNKTLAREFLDFMLTADFQRHIPLKNVMYPAVDLGDELPDVFDKLITPSETLYINPAKVATIRRQLVNDWLDALTD